MDGCNNLLAAIRAAATERFGFPERGNRDRRRHGHRRRQAREPRRLRRPRSGGHASRPRPAPTATARTPATSRSIRAPATSRSSTMSRSRTSASRSIRTSCTARRSARWCRGSAACSSTRSCYDEDAQMLNASLADYLVPLASDFSNVRAITMELRRSKTNPLGAKGAGEGGMVAVAATIGQCGGGRARAARRRGARSAAVAGASLAARQRRRCRPRAVTAAPSRRPTIIMPDVIGLQSLGMLLKA